jgi:hypothetical protein
VPVTASIDLLALLVAIGAGVTVLVAIGASILANRPVTKVEQVAEHGQYHWSASRNAWLTSGALNELLIGLDAVEQTEVNITLDAPNQPEAVLDQLSTGLTRSTQLAPAARHSEIGAAPEGQTVLHGTNQIVPAGIRLLGALSTTDVNSERPNVVIAQMSESTFEDRARTRQADWDAAIVGVLEAGHPITHIVPAPDPGAPNRLVEWIARVVKYAQNRGHYEQFLIPTASTNPLPVNLVLVPDVGALVSFAGPDPTSDMALMLEDPNQVRALLDVTKRILQRCEPVLTQIADREQFENILSEAERQEAPRYLVKAGLSTLQIPPRHPTRLEAA